MESRTNLKNIKFINRNEIEHESAPLINFNTFLSSFEAVFITMTVNTWNEIMMELIIPFKHDLF